MSNELIAAEEAEVAELGNQFWAKVRLDVYQNEGRWLTNEDRPW